MVMVKANSMTEAIRRDGMSFIHEPKTAWVARFNWPGQGGVKVDAEPAVRPVVKQGVRVEQSADLSGHDGPARVVPTTGQT